jgi:hypothetical protein
VGLPKSGVKHETEVALSSCDLSNPELLSRTLCERGANVVAYSSYVIREKHGSGELLALGY